MKLITNIMRKTVKIKFLDHYSSYDPQPIIDILKKRYDVELSDDPDFLFCSVYDNKHFYYDNPIKILYTGENIVPNFNVYDYAIGFDHIEFEDRYLRLPLWQIYADFNPDYVPSEIKNMTREEKLNRKFCNFVYTNGWSKKRIEFFHMLSNYKQVDSGGRFMNNVGGPCESKFEFQKNYKFSIAFENFESNGYTTEKMTDSFLAGTIPLYWGNPRVAEEFNPEAFVNYYDYDSLDSMMKRVIELDKNDDEYIEMLSKPIFQKGYFTEGKAKERYENFFFHIIEMGTNAKRMKKKFYWNNEKYNKNHWRVKKFLHKLFKFKIDYRK